MPDKVTRDPTLPRILVSGHLPPPMGGIGAFYQSLLQSSLPEKVNLRFVQTSSQSRALSSSGQATFSNLISAIRDCARFTMAAWKHRPQVAHIATAEGLSFVKHSICVLIARLLGSRVLLHPHCSLMVLYTERKAWWKWMFRQVIRLTDGVIALSDEWGELKNILPSCEVYFLPNAINMQQYHEIAQGRLNQIQNDGTLQILYLGYAGKEKGSFDLIDAARIILSQNKHVSFHLVGDELTAGEREQLAQKIKSCGLDKQVILHLPAYDLAKMNFFRSADLFVYPSYHEGMPMAVIEAMASGLPIVATRVGGLPDMIVDGVNGYLVEPGDPDQLAGALQKLITQPQLRANMQRNSSQIAAEQYDMEQRVIQLVEIYQCALRAKKTQTAPRAAR